MKPDNLKEILKSLHENLETADVDGELKNLLQVLGNDIDHLLAKQERVPEDAAGLADRAQSISARFAAAHPTIEPALRELGNMLASIGI